MPHDGKGVDAGGVFEQYGIKPMFLFKGLYRTPCYAAMIAMWCL